MSFFPSSSGIIINGGTFTSISLPTQDAAASAQALGKRKERDTCESDDDAQADDLRKRRRCWSLETLDGLTIINKDEFDLNKELIRGIGYRVHSASHHGGLVAVKAFEGPRAKQDWTLEVAFSKEFLHSNVLKIAGVSDEKSKSNFILYRGITSEQKMQSLIATALRTDLNMSVQISMKAVKGIAAGLSYIMSQNIPLKCENFNIFTGYDNEPVISFGPPSIVHEESQNSDNEIDGCGVEKLSKICHQLFSKANSILYDDSPEREIVVYDREGFPRAPLEDEEGPNVSASENEDVSNPSNSTEKAKSRRTPRREVRWLDLGAENRSLESIKQRFEDRLDRFLSSSSKSLLRRITSPMDNKQRHILHQCPGYLREEITLASDVSKSVIVSHAFPSQSEVCSICGQLVKYNGSEPSILDGEKLGAPRYPLNNLQNKDSLSQSWALNKEDNVSCQWEDCGEVFAHLASLIHHIHNDHIGVHKSNYACGWTTCVQRGQPQTSRFALMSHIQSHADQTGSDFITDFSSEALPSPESELAFDYPGEKDSDSSITNSVFVPPSPPQLESVVDYSAFDSAASITSLPSPQTSYDNSYYFPYSTHSEQIFSGDDIQLQEFPNPVVSQSEKQMHRVVVGKKKEETSDAAQTIESSGWEDILSKQLREDEDLLAASAGYLSQDSAWIWALRGRLMAEEDKVNNAVTSSSSTSHTQLDWKEIPG